MNTCKEGVEEGEGCMFTRVRDSGLTGWRG